MWANVLDASKDWGKAPWEWAGGNPLVWFYRWIYYTNQRMLAAGDADEDED